MRGEIRKTHIRKRYRNYVRAFESTRGDNDNERQLKEEMIRDNDDEMKPRKRAQIRRKG